MSQATEALTALSSAAPRGDVAASVAGGLEQDQQQGDGRAGEGGEEDAEAARGIQRKKALLKMDAVPVETLAMLPDRILVCMCHTL